MNSPSHPIIVMIDALTGPSDLSLLSRLEQAGLRLERAKTEHHRCVWADGVRDETYCAAEDELAAARAAYRRALAEDAGADVGVIERRLSL